MSKRNKLIEELAIALRRSSAEGVILSQTIAQKVRLNSTDMECLDLLNLNGPLPAGKLAALTGLTTGAITGMIDRLEQAGYVRRETDPQDRRKVIIAANPARINSEIGPFYSQFDQKMNEFLEKYSDSELAVLLDFSTRAAELVQEYVASLRDEDK